MLAHQTHRRARQLLPHSTSPPAALAGMAHLMRRPRSPACLATPAPVPAPLAKPEPTQELVSPDPPLASLVTRVDKYSVNDWLPQIFRQSHVPHYLSPAVSAFTDQKLSCILYSTSISAYS